MGKRDPLFKKYFDIETSIVYLNDVVVQKNVEQRFKRSWGRFYPRALPLISDYRIERFEAFFRQLKRDGSDERYTRRVMICFISPIVGYGVFAREDIPPYSTLAHYAGLLMLDEEINPNHDSTFSFCDYKTFSIDGAKQGNWTRFMNHCPEKEKAIMLSLGSIILRKVHALFLLLESVGLSVASSFFILMAMNTGKRVKVAVLSSNFSIYSLIDLKSGNFEVFLRKKLA